MPPPNRRLRTTTPCPNHFFGGDAGAYHAATLLNCCHLNSRHVTLDINLGDGATVVTSELDMERNADSPGSDLFLDGEELKLFRVYVRDDNGEVTQLQVTAYSLVASSDMTGADKGRVDGMSKCERCNSCVGLC